MFQKKMEVEPAIERIEGGEVVLLQEKQEENLIEENKKQGGI